MPALRTGSVGLVNSLYGLVLYLTFRGGLCKYPLQTVYEDVTDNVRYLVYDIISEIGFGAPFGFIEQGKDVGGLIQGFHDGLPAFGLLARLYPFTDWMKSTFLKKYLVATPADDTGIGVLMRFRDRLIAERLQDIEEKKKINRVDLMQTFLEARTEDGKPLDMEYIRA